MERTHVFNSDGGNGGSGGSKLDITAMLPGMFGNKGIDPNLLALMNNGNGFGSYSRNRFFTEQVIINMEFCGGSQNGNNHTP